MSEFEMHPIHETEYAELLSYFSDSSRHNRIIQSLQNLHPGRDDTESDVRLGYKEFFQKFGFESCAYLTIHGLLPGKEMGELYDDLDINIEDARFGSLRSQVFTSLQRYVLTGKATPNEKRIMALTTLPLLESGSRNVNINTLDEAVDLLNNTFSEDLLKDVWELASRYSSSVLGDRLSGIPANYAWRKAKLFVQHGIITPILMNHGDFASSHIGVQLVDKESYFPGWKKIANEVNKHGSVLAIEVAVLNGLTDPAYLVKLTHEGLHLVYPASGSDKGPLYMAMLMASAGLIHEANLHYTEIHNQPGISEFLKHLSEKEIIQGLMLQHENLPLGSKTVWRFSYQKIPFKFTLDVQFGDPEWASGRNPLPDRTQGQFNFLYLHDLQVHGQIKRSDPKSWAASMPKAQVLGGEMIVLTQGDKQNFLHVHHGKERYAVSHVYEIGLDFGDEASAVLAKVKYN